MFDLTLIKKNGGVYIDSREIAEAIGKRHKHLLRDIRGYCEIMDKIGQSKFGPSDFFIESTFINAQNKEMPCYLLSKMGCEMVANKLTGEKGVLFTAAYVKKFNEMEEADLAAEIKAQAKPRLSEFNSAARTVLTGMAYCLTPPKRVMDFLRGVYKPLGIDVETERGGKFYTATEIASRFGIYSTSGKPHAHAVSAIISKLGSEILENHTAVIPYGLVGISMRYDEYIAEAVWGWLCQNEFPATVPYIGFEYHIRYDQRIMFIGFIDWKH